MLEAVVRPQSARAALSCLNGRQTALLAGGTLMMPRVNAGAGGLATLVSLDRAELAAISIVGDTVELGAMVRLSAIAREPALAVLHPVVAAIGNPTLRNSATVGGNLFAPPPYGDLATALLALDAVVVSEGPHGRMVGRLEPWLEAAPHPDEIVTAVRFERPSPHSFRFLKAMRRTHNSASIVTVAASLTMDGERVSAARIALGGVGPRPLLARSAEAALIGQELDEASLTGAGEAARGDIEPVDDAYASAWYRRQVLPVHLRRAILGR
jgi:CO/xanthine dehydrogenase FAD-binding subunit